MKQGNIVLLLASTFTMCPVLAGSMESLHVTIDVSSIMPGELQLELALYDNSDIVGDSWVFIDNVQLGGMMQADFESGTLEGFDPNLNPDSVHVVSGDLDGTGQFVMRLDEDPVTYVTFTWRNMSRGTTSLEFDVQMEASETVGFFGLDEFVVNVLDPNTLAPLLPQLPAGGVMAMTADGIEKTADVGLEPIIPAYPIPAVSTIGQVVVGLLLLTGGMIAFGRRRRAECSGATVGSGQSV